MDQDLVIARTRRWIASVVIGLNLCPFARRVFDADVIRYVVSEAADEATLLADLTRELRALAAAPRTSVETAILIHPHVLADFLDYNDFLEVAERALRRLGLEGVIQIAGFHPEYRFADTDADAVENFTNRSPYPMLHLLREASITEVDADEEELLEIPRRNIETLRSLGLEKVRQMLRAIDDPDGSLS